MKIASVVKRIKPTINENIEDIKQGMKEAKNNGADLVLFSECSLSGFIVGENVLMDRKVAMKATDKRIYDLCAYAKELQINVGIGFLEDKDGGFYDSYAIILKDGTIKEIYQRCSDTWHIKDKGGMYLEGEAVRSLVVDGLCITILICGDLFDDVLCAMISALETDLCIVPMARCFDKPATEKMWLEEEKEYIERVKLTETNVLLVNQLMDKENYFGGVSAITYNGTVESRLPINTEGIHYLDI
ncbi:MAG: carbon-nitrogen hydrolase family protein [Erysipelotrichales bacterium]|nr:carbon-nitrogen hydrolase family protein [Erysipelotrichales bacterium]